MSKKAFITGITGQDGSYLSELLLEKGYEVHGLIRRVADMDHPNIANVKDRIVFHRGDLTDGLAIHNSLKAVEPDEIYNLAAQSHVKVSFELPHLTTEINALGPLRILETMKTLGLNSKFYQASTSEMFGTDSGSKQAQNEDTHFRPASPYGAAKLFAHWITINYRMGYNIFACNGILYNHESPRRGELFVTRKISRSFANIVLGKQSHIELGNLNSTKDWGHAKDYVRAMWLMLQQDKPDDYVVSTQEQHNVRDFCEMSANYFDIQLEWEGSGADEVARNKKTGDVLIKVNPAFYRPVDVDDLLGDSSKARNVLGWKPEFSFSDLVSQMCESDYRLLSKNGDKA